MEAYHSCCTPPSGRGGGFTHTFGMVCAGTQQPLAPLVWRGQCPAILSEGNALFSRPTACMGLHSILRLLCRLLQICVIK